MTQGPPMRASGRRPTVSSRLDSRRRSSSKSTCDSRSGSSHSIAADLAEVRAWKISSRRLSDADAESINKLATQLEGSQRLSLSEDELSQNKPTPLDNLRSAWSGFRERNYVFLQSSPALRTWDELISLAALHAACFLPLALVFPTAQWPGADSLEGSLDICFLVDVAIRSRTSFMVRGNDVIVPHTIREHYLRGWLLVDFLSSFPFDKMVVLCLYGETPCPCLLA